MLSFCFNEISFSNMLLRKYSRESMGAFVIVFLCFGNGVLCLPDRLLHSDDRSENQSTDILAGSHTTLADASRTSFSDVAAFDVKSQTSDDGKDEGGERKAANETRKDNTASSQNFFDSFAPLFGNNSPLGGHSRPPPLLYPDHSFKPAAFKVANYRELQPFTGASDSILGSGNFGVVKGGTYYAEERDDAADFVGDNDPYSFLGSTHSRVYKKNPPPAFRNGGDFFAHFRDFADITAPSKSYSQYYVVYVNKNGTAAAASAEADATAPAASDVDETMTKPKPKRAKNIIEQLTMLDAATEEALSAHESTKQSKFKRKLADHRTRNLEKEKTIKSRLHDSPKEISEPLLALS